MAELPRQVQAQLEEAERIRAQMATPPTDTVDTDDPPSDPDPAPNPVPPEPAPAPAPGDPADDAAVWQQRFKSLEGKYRSEVGPLHEQLRAQSAQLQTLTAELTAFRQSQQTPPATPEQPLVTAKDEETFGADIVNLARRVSQEQSRALEKRLATIEAALTNLTPQVKRVEKVAEEVALTREERFWSELTAAVPDWEMVNQDPAWLKWLQEYDPVAGTPRQVSLTQAQQTLDHRRAAALFKLFKAQTAPAQPTQKTKSRSELTRQVAPTRSSTVTVPPTAEKTYTGTDYLYWLDPRRAHDTDPKDLLAMKAEMDRAFAEGRVQF